MIAKLPMAWRKEEVFERPQQRHRGVLGEAWDEDEQTDQGLNPGLLSDLRRLP